MIQPQFEMNFSLVCQSCGAMPVQIFHELKGAPVHSVLNIYAKREAVEFPTARIALGICPHCGFISNTAFETELLEYASGYESTQSYSPTFKAFARRQAEQLIERHGLKGKRLLEIGCGNGEFLHLLCELGDNEGMGFDPAHVEGRVKGAKDTKVTFVRDYYSEKYADFNADFLYCKMTLEHIYDTGAFIRMVRRSIGDRLETIVFFQVPDVTRILRDCAFEDIYYEHCSYFSPGSLAALFRRSGFDVIALERDYNEQYVMIDAKPLNDPVPSTLPTEDGLDKLQNWAAEFPRKLDKKLFRWRARLQQIKSENRKAVIWGSGSKGVTFLTTLGIGDEIQYAVDVNPHRQGTYMAGTGHEIVSPGFLKTYEPDVVIIMNSIYKSEIQRDLGKMGLSPEILNL